MSKFKITIKQTGETHFVKNQQKHELYYAVEDIVGDDDLTPNGIPTAIEADGWGDFAYIGEKFEHEKFTIELID